MYYEGTRMWEKLLMLEFSLPAVLVRFESFCLDGQQRLPGAALHPHQKKR